MAKKKKVVKKATKKKVVKKAAPKKSAAKKSSKKVAKKVTKKKVTPKKVAKKATTKKATAKKTTKKVASKVTTKKATAKKTTKKVASKVTTKKATAKKVVAKKATKKAVQKKTVQKKTPTQVSAEKTPSSTPEPKAKKTKVVSAKKSIPPVSADDIEIDEDDEEDDEAEVILTDAEGRRYCSVSDCDQLSMVEAYCRYHYLLYWKKIQRRKKILSGGKFEVYVKALTERYSDKFVDLLCKDLKSEKIFVTAIQELDLDDKESKISTEDEEANNYMEEIRGVSDASGSDSHGSDSDY